MPKTKSSASAAIKKTPKSIKKTGEKNKLPRKKKAIIVDIIADEELNSPVADFSFPDLPPRNVESYSPDTPAALDSPDEHPEIDQQKRFFSDLVADMKNKSDQVNSSSNSEVNSKKIRKNLGLYRRLVVKFVILVLVLAALVTYFSFSKLTIIITPQGETIKDSLLLKASGQSTTTTPGENDPREAVAGSLQLVETQTEKIYPATGEDFLGQEIVGQVKIINNYSKSQALIATTRLLSPDNKLFRIKEAVNIPAGGEVTVDIYADKPSADLAIGPTTFTIPGLWLGLQAEIFAQNDVPFVFQQKTVKYIKETDLQRASDEASNLLLKQAAEQIASGDQGRYYLYTLAAPLSLEINARAEAQQENFTAKVSGQVAVVSFSKEEAARIVASRLNFLVPDDKELIGFDKESLVYSLENFDIESGVATVKVSFSGVMALKQDSEIIDRRQLINLNEEQIDQYLRDLPGIKNYELKFSPSFIKKAPNLLDRIQVKINKL